LYNFIFRCMDREISVSQFLQTDDDTIGSKHVAILYKQKLYFFRVC